jgi:ABC-2 type transport system permease protein
VLGFVLLVVLTSLWAVVFAGFMQLIALTRPMEIAATCNPVTYVMEACAR